MASVKCRWKGEWKRPAGCGMLRARHGHLLCKVPACRRESVGRVDTIGTQTRRTLKIMNTGEKELGDRTERTGADIAPWQNGPGPISHHGRTDQGRYRTMAERTGTDITLLPNGLGPISHHGRTDWDRYSITAERTGADITPRTNGPLHGPVAPRPDGPS